MRHHTVSGAAASMIVLCAAAFAQPSPIGGGGADNFGGLIGAETKLHNTGSGCSAAAGGGTACRLFGPFGTAGSAPAIIGFLTDDLGCDFGKCLGKGGVPGNTADYAVPDYALGSREAISWTTGSFGQSVAGNLIQVPSFGVGLAVPVVNAAIGANGAATFSDSDLCGIFSGLINNGAQITDSKTPLQPGPLTVAYRADATGETLWLTAHLAGVCTAANSAIPFFPTTSFASLFPQPGGVPANFVPFASQNGMAAYLAGCGGVAPPVSGLGYLTPDATTLTPNSNTVVVCANGATERSPLVVAGLIPAAGVALLPTVANITLGLANAAGVNLTAPKTKQDAQNPTRWAPVVNAVRRGYPLVGYGEFVFAQCYADTAVAPTLRSFTIDAYGVNKAYGAITVNNGFVPMSSLAANGYVHAVEIAIVSNKTKWGLDIGDAGVCAGLPGR